MNTLAAVTLLVDGLTAVTALSTKLQAASMAIQKAHAEGREMTDAEKVARGEYLTTIMGCNDCHTPGTFFGAPDFGRKLSGSELGWVGPWGTTYARNLTPDAETGIGSWSADDIVKTIRTGQRADGTEVLPPSQVLVFQQHCHAATKEAGVALLECGMWVGPELFSAQAQRAMYQSMRSLLFDVLAVLAIAALVAVTSATARTDAGADRFFRFADALESDCFIIAPGGTKPARAGHRH